MIPSKTITILAAIAFFCGGLFTITAQDSPFANSDYFTNQPIISIEQYEVLHAKANLGNPFAQFLVGALLKSGDLGITVNDKKAFHWHLKSAKQGLSPAQASVALSYFTGKGVDQNWIEGIAWTLIAKSNGFKPSSQLYSRLEKRRTNKELEQAQARAEEIQKEIAEVLKKKEADERNRIDGLAWLLVKKENGDVLSGDLYSLLEKDFKPELRKRIRIRADEIQKDIDDGKLTLEE